MISRIRKKIEKRAAELLIKAKIFDASDWDSLNLCFYSQDYYGECNEINAWNYLESLAVEATVKYVEVDMDSGYYTELGKKDDLSIIEAINIFKENYLAGKRLEVESEN
ncbi:MAG: hypothetical protein C0495_06685 [Acinetobacter sp.]|nr:hypothetical protein [Acinetobacter sp.]